MRRGWKIALGVGLAVIVLLGLNALATDGDTEPAAVTVRGGEILDLPGGDVQVLERGSPQADPIVLIHCFTCSIRWWDAMMPQLERDHRVVAVDLLGHGGSEKPSSGYGMPEQADLLAQALARRGVREATVVGHSLGGTVATALAERSPQIVERLVVVDQAPGEGYGAGLGLLAELTFKPVLGEALWRLKTGATIKSGLGDAFAPGYDVPDAFVEDLRRMTYSSYDESAQGENAYTEAIPLDRRIERAGVPLLAVFGAEEQIYDSRKALDAYARLPGAETVLVPGAGHSPNVETPRRTAALVLSFAEKR